MGDPEGEERERSRKNILRNGQKLHKFDKRQKYTHTSSTISKRGKHKEIHLKAHYKQIVKRQRQKENLESCEKFIPYKKSLP